MAVKTNPDVTTPKSTSAVKFDGAPVETTQVADPSSTNVVEYQPPGETRAEHLDAKVTVVAPTPGPTTMTVSWLPEAKVVEAPAKAPAKKAAAKVTTKKG